jgi:hypothetical protein
VGKKLQLQKSNSNMTLMHALKYGTHKGPKLGTHKSKISAKYPFYHHQSHPDSSLTFKSKKFNNIIDPGISSILLLDYGIGLNFWKFYLIKTSFTLLSFVIIAIANDNFS